MIESSSTKVEFSQVISKISEEKWEFPPGGGFQAKLDRRLFFTII